MKTALVNALIASVLLLFCIISVNSCGHYKNKYKSLQAEHSQLQRRADSLSNRAAIDCDQKISNALKSLQHAQPTDSRPPKPAILR